MHNSRLFYLYLDMNSFKIQKSRHKKYVIIRREKDGLFHIKIFQWNHSELTNECNSHINE